MNFVVAQSESKRGPIPPPLFAKTQPDTTPAGTPPSAVKAQASRVRMTVTSEQAEVWLKQNTHNRRLREFLAMRYATDMEEGRWKYNHTAILISSDGTIIDGQHRLMACTLAKTAFDTDVVFNADPTIRDTIDIGAARRAADMGDLDGIKNSTRVAAAATLLIIYRKHGIAMMHNPRVHPSKPEIHAEMLGNPQLGDAVITGPAGRICAPRVIDFCNYLFRQQNAQLAGKFMRDVLIGEGLSKTNPAYLLRERLTADARSKAKLRVKDIIALFFKTWIAYRDNKPLRCLRWVGDGSNAEAFPEI